MPAARCQHLLDLLAQVEAGWLVWVVIESAGESVVTADGAYWRRSSDRVRAGELPPQGLITGDPSGSSGTLPIAGESRVFVAMSFREEEEPALVDYWQAMLRAAEKARRDFQLTRVDEVEGDYEIVEQLYREIGAAHLVIADLTLSPPNVYLEIGYARGRSKQVIQTCRADTRLEFDVRGRRALIYRNATMLEHMLLSELDALWRAHCRFAPARQPASTQSSIIWPGVKAVEREMTWTGGRNRLIARQSPLMGGRS
jgi:hypothetical protein